VLIAQESISAELIRQLKRAGAYCSARPNGTGSPAAVPGRAVRHPVRRPDATKIAAEAGVRVPRGTPILLAPFAQVVPEEPLAHEKLCPVARPGHGA